MVNNVQFSGDTRQQQNSEGIAMTIKLRERKEVTGVTVATIREETPECH